MKTHEELVEDVYNNVSFRSEFISYARLWSSLRTEQQLSPKAPSAPNPDGVNFIAYHDLLTNPKVEPDSPQVVKCKRGIAFLYSSLSRALTVAHKLNAEETRRLIFAVADRYAQRLNF